MNNILGTVVTAMIVDKNENHLFAQKDGTTFKVLDEDVTKYEIGEMITGFAYVNIRDEHVMMTQEPTVKVGSFGWGEVVEVKRDLGVFVDVSWLEKDLVVSLDDLPAVANVWPRKGDRLYLSVKVDNKNRMWGELISHDQLIQDLVPGTEAMHNEDVKGTVVQSLKAGTYVYLEDGYIGFIHPSEREREPRLGEEIEARVIGLRDDNVLYLSMHPRAHEVLDEDAAMIFTILKRSPNHRIPYHDKSDPTEIREYFGISKGQFKRAIGRLMKERLVLQDQEGTYLTEAGLEREL